MLSLIYESLLKIKVFKNYGNDICFDSYISIYVYIKKMEKSVVFQFMIDLLHQLIQHWYLCEVYYHLSGNTTWFLSYHFNRVNNESLRQYFCFFV